MLTNVNTLVTINLNLKGGKKISCINKHIQAAIDYAILKGWTFKKSSGQAKCYGRLTCSNPGHKDHIMSVNQTPRVPEHHASMIKRKVNKCSSNK